MMTRRSSIGLWSRDVERQFRLSSVPPRDDVVFTSKAIEALIIYVLWVIRGLASFNNPMYLNRSSG